MAKHFLFLATPQIDIMVPKKLASTHSQRKDSTYCTQHETSCKKTTAGSQKPGCVLFAPRVEREEHRTDWRTHSSSNATSHPYYYVQYATFQEKKESLNREDSVTSLACLSRLFKHVTLITLLCTK
jgi:hypothetical protein